MCDLKNTSINGEEKTDSVFSPNAPFLPKEQAKTANKADLVAIACFLSAPLTILIVGAALLFTGVAAPVGVILIITSVVFLSLYAFLIYKGLQKMDRSQS